MNCLRCNKKLTNTNSIKLGYGKICYKKHLLEVNKTQEKNELIETIDFLKCEIKMIKLQLKNIKNNTSNSIPIERIQNTHRPEQNNNLNHTNMNEVMKEMKTLFQSVDNIRDLLKPINPLQVIELPPILINPLVI